MQGLHDFIPTQKKIEYLNALLQVGFHTLDFGSFVSAKAIPQLQDTKEVYEQLEWRHSSTGLLAIIANVRGAIQTSQCEGIKYLGFPFSISETFQNRNTNSSIEESLERVLEIQEICIQFNKQLVIYISMGFGNPYGDPWSAELAMQWIHRLNLEGIRIISMSDTIGIATPNIIQYMIRHILDEFKNIELGVHLHSIPEQCVEKVQAAYEAGCRRFDGAIRGFGGCPMASDKLTGNMATEQMISYFQSQGLLKELHMTQFQKCMQIATSIFPN